MKNVDYLNHTFTIALLLLISFISPCFAASEIDHHGSTINATDSTECLDCHTDDNDQKLDSTSNSCTSSKNNSHPVKVDFPPADKKKLFKSAEDAKKSGIRFNNGKITCLSCHDLKKDSPKHLIIQNKNSKLCFACHKM